jgi:hypothetical protein
MKMINEWIAMYRAAAKQESFGKWNDTTTHLCAERLFGSGVQAITTREEGTGSYITRRARQERRETGILLYTGLIAIVLIYTLSTISPWNKPWRKSVGVKVVSNGHR